MLRSMRSKDQEQKRTEQRLRVTVWPSVQPDLSIQFRSFVHTRVCVLKCVCVRMFFIKADKRMT